MFRTIHTAVFLQLAHLGDVWIAGGAVRDELMGKEPKDFDVFVSCDESRSGEIVKAMAAFECMACSEYHKSEPFLMGTWRILGKIVQVMWTPHKTVDSLLGSFDWNVALFAFDGKDTHALEAIENIAVGKSLRLCSVTYPVSTLRRGFRFSERFGMKIEMRDLLALCEMILARSKKVGA